MEVQILFCNVGKFDPHPATHAHIGWFKVNIGRGFDQAGLKAIWHRQPNRHMTVIVMIVGEHDEHFLVNKEGRLAMRKLFTCFGECKADSAHAL